MSTLRSVHIRDLRRYETRDLPLGEGATILLAPNGTGKTAFFEAVELGLTGELFHLRQRFKEQWRRALVRDGASRAEVALRFDAGELRTILPAQAGEPSQRSGDAQMVLGEHVAEGLAWRLRLTHLLDQRSERWAARQTSGAAGDMFHELPVGRDLANAAKALRSARNSSTIACKTAEEVERKANEALSRWVACREELAQLMAATGLEPLPALRAALVEAGLLDTTSQTADTTEALAVAAAASHATLERRRESLGQRRRALETAAGLSDEWAVAEEQRERREREHESAQDKLAVREAEAAQAVEQDRQARGALKAASDRVERCVRARQRLEQRGGVQAKLTSITSEIEGILSRVAEAERALEAADGVLTRARTVAAEHDALARRRAGVARDLETLSQARADLPRLVALDAELAQLARSRDPARAGEAKARSDAETARGRVLRAQTAHTAAAERHASIAAAVAGMQAAVEDVRRHLPADRGDCPVCGVEHGPIRLRQRIEQSLHDVNPALRAASEALGAATRELEAAKAQSEVAEQEVRATHEAEQNRLRRERELTEERDALLRTPLLAAAGVDGAHEALDAEAGRLAAASVTIAAEEQALPHRPSETDLDEGHAREAAITLSNRRKALEEARAVRALSNAEFSRILASEHDWAQVEADAAGIAEAEILHADASGRAGRTFEEVSATTVTVKAAREELDLLARQRAEASAGVQALVARWSALELPGVPDAQVYADAMSTVDSARVRLEEQSDVLSHVSVEIGRWRAAEHRQRVQADLDEQRGPATEDEHDANLREAVAVATTAHQRAKLADAAMSSLASAFDAQQKELLSHTRAILPAWRSLLRRVVREPRFANANLNRYTYNRSEHAELQVDVNGEHLDADAVASEAQLTDVQLTLLLTMARTHAWSNWRCLLLDDPTQHHDLVAAGAVFEVLREYVGEHGFQIVLATHDATQARYFERMLKNDDLPVRVHRLG